MVAKLFAIAGPCRAYFGLKDFQQLAVVRCLAHDLSLPVEVVGCPIVREPDGLALSSRNVRLSAGEREAATALSRALAAGRAAVASGGATGAAVGRGHARPPWALEPLVRLDYAVVVDAAHARRAPDAIDDPRRAVRLVAAQVGPVRLIDNSAALETADEVPAVPDATDQVRRLESSRTRSGTARRVSSIPTVWNTEKR